jgi:uncharacterized membrane protein YkgB
MNRFDLNRRERIDRVSEWLGRHSVALLRISLGLVFLGFGVLKFFPGVSPAEELAAATLEKLTLGLVPPDIARLLVAAHETTVGVLLISGRGLRLGVALLGLASVGILSPLVLFPAQLFGGPGNAPTLEGQYVLKDVVLLAGAIVVAFGGRAARLATEPNEATTGHPADHPAPVGMRLRPTLDRAA